MTIEVVQQLFLWLMLGLTIVVTVESYRLLHLYRRVTGDTSHSYLSPNRGRWLSLLFQRYPQAELAQHQARLRVLTLLWVIGAVVLLLMPPASLMP